MAVEPDVFVCCYPIQWEAMCWRVVELKFAGCVEGQGQRQRLGIPSLIDSQNAKRLERTDGHF
jgi:hypothetical protein